MKKVAKLVRVSLVTRVVVNEDATEQEIMELAIPKLSENLMDAPFENIDEIVEDLECPAEQDLFWYKDEGYQLRTFAVEDSFKSQLNIVIAPVSLYKALGGEGPFEENSLEEEIDDAIYYYLEDNLTDLDAKTICEQHLDEPLKFIHEHI